jgi:hypothetical protein
MIFKNVANGLVSTFEGFTEGFKTKTHDVSYKALVYLQGLFKSEKNRANCVSISDTLGSLESMGSSPPLKSEVLKNVANNP